LKVELINQQMRKNLKWVDVLLLILALIIMILGIGDYGLYEPHEGHFAMVGKEMVLRGDLITPTLNGSPYLNKTPLLYWLIAISTKFLGTTEFAARLPLALSGWLGIAIAFFWSRDLWGIKASRIVVLMLSATLGWFIFTHQLLIDVLLATLLLASNYFFWRLLSDCRFWLNFFGLYICLSLSLLAKGPIAILFPMVSLVCLILRREDWSILKEIKLGYGILLTLLLVLPWFIAVELANPGFIFYFIFNEHLNRLFDVRFPPDYEVSKISAFGYLGITAVWCLPWTFCLPQVVISTWKDCRSSGNRKYREGVFLLAIATLMPILFFLPLSSRLIYYSIPAIPPYIILCAGWWSQRKSDSTTWSNIFLGSLFIILGLSLIAAVIFLPSFFQSLTAIAQKIDISKLIMAIGISLGFSWILAGISLLQTYWQLSLIPLWVGFAITYKSITTGFTIYDYIRSSKILIKTASPCLSLDTLWIFEGSRELGAAGGMSYYLNQKKTYFRRIVIGDSPQVSVGWVMGGKNRIYRQIMVLDNSGNNRLLPNFPGGRPSYLISQQQFQAYWDSDRPVVFVTDFLRKANDPLDPPELNLPKTAEQPLLVVGSRRLYGNSVAKHLWCQK
jgi:4-amino-4-deoxy-L-arabinose transferase-like glycosyltransferase